MGQTQGTPDKKDEEPDAYMNTLEGNLDKIASDFILRQNFQDMRNLMEKDKCDELVVLTTELVSKYFRGMDVSYLNERFAKNKSSLVEETGAVRFIRRKTLDDQLKKESDDKIYVCIGIAKFYVQIAHLFAAITMTVNPKYTYTVGATSSAQVGNVSASGAGEQGFIPYKEQRVFQEYGIPGTVSRGAERTVGWEDKDKIPKDMKVQTTFHGICDNRIKVLKNNNEFPLDKKDAILTINPRICDIEPVQNLYQEPGIPELESLYLDKYDLGTGKFVEMSDKMRKKYNADLKLFYTAFTGEQNMPDSITKFSDIPIIQYQDRVGCLKKTAQFDFGFNFQGGIVRMGDNGDVMYFGKDGTETGEFLADAKGFTEPFKVESTSQWVGKPGYKITLKGSLTKTFSGRDYQPSVTFTNGFSGMYRNPQKGTLQDKLFKKYAEKLRNMINKTKQNKESLLKILEQIFEKGYSGDSDVPVVRISKSLDKEKLAALTDTTRETIVSMYLSCERDFVDLLNVFDAIIGRQILAEAESTQEELRQLTYRYQDNVPTTSDQPAVDPAVDPAVVPAADPAVDPAVVQDATRGESNGSPDATAPVSEQDSVASRQHDATTPRSADSALDPPPSPPESYTSDTDLPSLPDPDRYTSLSSPPRADPVPSSPANDAFVSHGRLDSERSLGPSLSVRPQGFQYPAQSQGFQYPAQAQGFQYPAQTQGFQYPAQTQGFRYTQQTSVPIQQTPGIPLASPAGASHASTTDPSLASTTDPSARAAPSAPIGLSLLVDGDSPLSAADMSPVSVGSRRMSPRGW